MGGLGFDISKSQLSFSTHSIIIYNTHRRATLLLCCGIYFPFCSIMRMRSLSKATQEGPAQRLQGSGEECTWTWMDTVEWADSHYCAFAEHMAAQVISAVVSRFALTPPAPPVTPNAPLQSQMKAQGSDARWLDVLTSPPEQLLRPQRPRKRSGAAAIRLSYLLSGCPPPCLLMRPSRPADGILIFLPIITAVTIHLPDWLTAIFLLFLFFCGVAVAVPSTTLHVSQERRHNSFHFLLWLFILSWEMELGLILFQIIL